MPQCSRPVTIKDANGIHQVVPCSKCANCKKRRGSEWSFRLVQQDKIAISSHFITLTYDTDNVPITKNKYMSLHRQPKGKSHLQLFLKRLRKAHEGLPDLQPIKYYACGEYGGRTMRPHYHIILFNAKLELISPAWTYGHCHYGSVSGASIGYTLKYIQKPGKIPLHQNDDRVPEFAFMSKGLGKNYLTENMIAWHRADLNNRMYVNVDDKKKASMPRYYKQRIYADYERKMIGELALEKMKEQEYKDAALDPNYSRNKAQAADALEQRRIKNSQLNQTL